MVKCGLYFGALIACISASATLWFLGQILLWTFALAVNPIDALVRMVIWAVVFSLALLLLHFLPEVKFEEPPPNPMEDVL